MWIAHVENSSGICSSWTKASGYNPVDIFNPTKKGASVCNCGILLLHWVWSAWLRDLEIRNTKDQFWDSSALLPTLLFSTLTFSHGQQFGLGFIWFSFLLQFINNPSCTGQIVRSLLSRFVVMIWCFVVLVLVQSCIASLSSLLTADRL